MNLHKLKWVYWVSLVLAAADICYFFYNGSRFYHPDPSDFFGGAVQKLFSFYIFWFFPIWWLVYFGNTKKYSDLIIPFLLCLPFTIVWLYASLTHTNLYL
jgi:hypothetical protein